MSRCGCDCPRCCRGEHLACLKAVPTCVFVSRINLIPETGPAPEKSETRMDTEIARRTDPPQPPDFDPPNGYGSNEIPPPAPSTFHDPELQRLSDEMDKIHAAQGKPGAVARRDCIDALRMSMAKTGLSSLYGEEELAATADAYIQATLAALAIHETERAAAPEAEDGLDDRLAGAEVAAKALSDRVDALEKYAREFEVDLCEALGLSNPDEIHDVVDFPITVRHLREERDRLLEEVRSLKAHVERYESGQAEREVRKALGARVGETTLEAATRVAEEMASRGRDLERMWSTGPRHNVQQTDVIGQVRALVDARDEETTVQAVERVQQGAMSVGRAHHALRVTAEKLFAAMKWSGDAEPHAPRVAWADFAEALFGKEDSRTVGLRAAHVGGTPAADHHPNVAAMQTLDRVLRIGSAIVNLQRAITGKGGNR